MKKTYVKPALAVESFVLSQSIAVNCGVPGGGTEMGAPNHVDKISCGWEMDSATVIWLDTMANICTFPVGEDEPVYGMCYNNPNGGVTIFGS